MKLSDPFIITARLMAGVKIGDAFISIATGQRDAEGRTQYGAYIDIPGQPEHHVTDLSSGCGGGGTSDGMESLLSFLGACGKSYGYAQRNGKKLEDTECGDLFPEYVAEWAHQNSDEISMTQMEIEENPGCVEE